MIQPRQAAISSAAVGSYALDGERRLGELLKATELAQGKRTDLVPKENEVQSKPTLADLGIHDRKISALARARVNQRLGGYVKIAIEERRKVAIPELKAKGFSNVKIGEILGTNERTVRRDLNSANAEQSDDDSEENQVLGENASANAEPLDTLTALAATDKIRTVAQTAKTRQAKQRDSDMHSKTRASQGSPSRARESL